MCEQITAILSSIDFWKITIPVVIVALTWYLNERSKRKWEMWQIKKEACLKALNLANAVLSNYKYQDLREDMLIPQYESIEDARSCFNELACTCKSSGVIDSLKKILFDNVRPDAIIDLRDAVRKELQFGTKTIDKDKEKAFLAKLNCVKKMQHYNDAVNE